MPKSRQAIALLLLGALTGALGLSLTAASNKSGLADLNLMDLNGGAVHLRDYRGKRLVVNFWATWCIPCQHEMPMFVELEKKWTARGVFFAGASLDERKTRKAIPEFLRKFQIDFPIWVGATGDDLAKLDMGEAVPATAFINEEGVIFARVEGEIKREELEERLEWMTGDRSRQAPKALVRNL